MLQEKDNKDCGGCKDTPYLDRLDIYIVNNHILTESKTVDYQSVLMDKLGFSKDDVETAMKLASIRGECMVYSGDRESVISKAEELSTAGVYCRIKQKVTR